MYWIVHSCSLEVHLQLLTEDIKFVWKLEHASLKIINRASGDAWCMCTCSDRCSFIISSLDETQLIFRLNKLRCGSLNEIQLDWCWSGNFVQVHRNSRGICDAWHPMNLVIHTLAPLRAVVSHHAPAALHVPWHSLVCVGDRTRSALHSSMCRAPAICQMSTCQITAGSSLAVTRMQALWKWLRPIPYSNRLCFTVGIHSAAARCAILTWLVSHHLQFLVFLFLELGARNVLELWWPFNVYQIQ